MELKRAHQGFKSAHQRSLGLKSGKNEPDDFSGFFFLRKKSHLKFLGLVGAQNGSPGLTGLQRAQKCAKMCKNEPEEIKRCLWGLKELVGAYLKLWVIFFVRKISPAHNCSKDLTGVQKDSPTLTNNIGAH